ncbi:MAG: hypothetical protein PHE48_02750 [Candidatus Daviesbacteria bacterium]|nr:hypothetical protein [Candidatus Daviesbacteria bacterium]
MEQSSKLLVVLTGKTASGKDTVMAKLLSRFPGFERVITTTSRHLRPGEKNGVDYNFISEPDFREKIDKGDFIEYVEYGGNLYGTEKSQITNNLHKNLIWRIDPSRAGQIRKFIKDSFEPNLAEDLLKKVKVIYLTVNDDVVLTRLKKRGLREEEIAKRMSEDAKFWQEFKDSYDFVVENIPGKLDEAVSRVCNLIRK